MKAGSICPSRYVTYRRNTYTPYPGAEGRRSFWERLLDAALAAAITVAVVVAFLFVLVLVP